LAGRDMYLQYMNIKANEEMENIIIESFCLIGVLITATVNAIFQWKQAFYGIKLTYSLRRQKKDPVGYIRIMKRWPKCKRANERGKFRV
jgi:hypothetical protein